MDLLAKIQTDGPWKAAAIAAGVYGSFFVLYSGYKKGTTGKNNVEKSFSGSFDLKKQLGDIFGKLTEKSAQRQLNKVVALAGLTLTGAASIPRSLAWKDTPLTRQAVLNLGVGSLVAHVSYSVFDYYKASIFELWEANSKPSHKFEKLALVAGAGALATYGWVAFTEQNLNAQKIGDTLAVASLAGVAHFYFIETATGKPQDLPVRPWGYVGFIVPLAAVGACVANKLM